MSPPGPHEPHTEERDKKKRRFIPPISLEHILLTELINAPSPVTPHPIPIPTPPSGNKESTKKRMAITELVNSPKKQKIFDEPLTPEGRQTPLPPLPPLRLLTPASPYPRPFPDLKPLHPPLPRVSGHRQLEALATLATTPIPQRASNKKRKFICGICNFGFHQAGGLRNHTNAVHLKQKPFACTWPTCGRFGKRGFAARGDLTRHVNSVHRGERNFRCDRCNMRFARRSVLVRHLRNIHKVAVPGRRQKSDDSVSGSASASASGSN